VTSARYVLGLSALLGGVMMLGLARALPASRAAQPEAKARPATKADADAGARARTGALVWLNGVLLFVLAAFELGIVLQGQQQASSRQAALMFAECSLVMLAVNAGLFLTALLEKVSPRILIGVGLVLAMGGLGVMAAHTSDAWMFLGVGMSSAGIGLVLPVIAYLAASASPLKLGATMGGLAAAAGLGQTLGSAAGGWLFGALAQLSFAWLGGPLALMLALLLVRPGWWSLVAVASAASTAIPLKPTRRPTSRC
jgi:MFS family permease